MAQQRRPQQRYYPKSAPRPTDKACAVCGRRIDWRRKWRNNWYWVKYCSKKCRQSGLKPLDRQLEGAIMQLLIKRCHGATICPSEAAQTVRLSPNYASWQVLMPAARNAARRLAASHRIVILQAGRPVDPSTAKGPIRLRLAMSKFAGEHHR